MSALPRPSRPIRLAARALLLHDDRLLLVNAYPGGTSDLWCAPGGGVEPHSSLPDNLRREVYEETGLCVTVGAPCLVNEFHDTSRDFHQVDVYFRCTLETGTLDAAWRDPEGIVTERRFVSREDMAALRVKPDSLIDLAFGPPLPPGEAGYDPLEPLVG